MASELKPTPETIDSVCLSYRHDFGLLDEASKRPIRSEALWWFEAWQKEGYFVTRPAPATDINVMDGPFHVSRSGDGEREWYSARDAASGVSIPAKNKADAQALVASLNRACVLFSTRPAPAATDTGLSLDIDKDWFEKRAAQEGDLEISAGRRAKIVNLSPEEIAELERLMFEALPRWAQDELTRLRAQIAKPATDTGLVTAIKKAEKELLERIADTYGDSIANDIADYLGRIGDAARSQAEELLSAEREKALFLKAAMETAQTHCGLMDKTIALAETAMIEMHQDLNKVEADNAAQAARIKELENANIKWMEFYATSNDRAEALEAKLVAAEQAARAAHDTLIEINPANYNHDDVCQLNDASVEAIFLLADILGETHGKTKEWWDERRAVLGGKPS